MTGDTGRRPGTNTGHGHVWERPDGAKARCGGPGLCKKCAEDARTVETLDAPPVAGVTQ